MGPVVVALDSFKGSLDATRASAALARGLRGRDQIEVHEHPVADGGEGTLAALAMAGFTLTAVDTVDPLGRPVRSRYAHRAGVAVVELAEASGLGRLADIELTPATAMATSTYGTGQVMAAALDAGHETIVVGLGGSATTDGGSGLLAALGGQLFDPTGRALRGTPSPLPHVHSVDLSALHRMDQVRLVAACDVDNPLLGAQGAAAIYGPQKGADEAAIAELDSALARLAGLVQSATGVRAARTPGAGAAGGAGFALLALGARIRSGIELVLDLTGLAERLSDACLVITGEGSLDQQTLRGKAPAGVAAAARAAGVPVVGVAGRNLLTPDELAAAGFQNAYALTDIEPDVDRCVTNAEILLEQLGERIAHGLVRH